MDNEQRDKMDTLLNMVAAVLQKAGAKATKEEIIAYFAPDAEPMKELEWEDTKKFDEGDVNVLLKKLLKEMGVA